MKMGDFDILSIQVREDIQKNAVKYQPMSGLRLVRSGDKRIPYGQVLFCEIFTILELFDESQNMFCFGKLKQPALN